MKSLLKSIYFAVLGIVFSGCSYLFFNPTLDLSLSPLQNIQVLPDVSSIAFEWKRINDANITGFAVYRKDGNTGEFKLIDVIENPIATHFYDTNLKSESIYAYQFAVLGKNKTISPRSKTYLIKTSYIDPLETLYASSDEPRLVKLIWNPHQNPSIEKYVIEKKVNNEWKKIGEVDHRLGVEFFDTHLLDGTTYEYRVAGVSFQGDKSKYSPIAKATTKFPPPPITGVKASTDVPKLIILKWDSLKIADLEGYVIYASQKEKGDYKKIAQIDKAYYEFRTQENGERWFFKIVALDKDGIQGSLNILPTLGTSLPPPEKPILKGVSVQEGDAVIGWDKPSERVTEVIVYRKEGVFGDQLVFKVDSENTKFVDREMKKGVEYIYWVEFVDVHQIHSLPSEQYKLKRD